MRVIKPQSLGIVTRPFEYQGRMFLGVAICGFTRLDGGRTLLTEAAMWAYLARALPEGASLDAGIPKRGGEFLVTGSAWPDPESESTRCRVRAQLGGLDKSLNVFGNRLLTRDGVIGPEPFESMPLNWENAYGGEGFATNPLGKGIADVVLSDGRKATPMPNIVLPDGGGSALPGSSPEPAGFGPIDANWPQRRDKAGTYGRTWLEKHYPEFAPDIDWAYFSIAPPGQAARKPFRGDEQFRFQGLHPEARVQEGKLPAIQARCLVRRRAVEEIEDIVTALTTVWFFPNDGYAALVFHASAEVKQPDAGDIGELMIAAETLGESRSLSHYSNALARRLDPKGGALEKLNDAALVPPDLDRPGSLDADQLYRDFPESIRYRNSRRHARKVLADAENQIAEGMAEFGVTPPEVEQPDLGIDPDDLSSLSLGDVPELLDRLKREQKKSHAELEQRKSEGEQQLTEAIEQLRADFPDADIKPIGPIVGPPDFSAEEYRREIRAGIDGMRNESFDGKVMDEALLGEEMSQLLDSAEKAFVDFYRRGAHFQTPAPRAARDDSLRQSLLDDISAGKSLDARDLTGADLSEMDFSGADLRGVFAESADLSRANLAGAQLDNAVLANADLTGARLDGARLHAANLGQARLRDVAAIDADFSNAIFHKTDLGHAKLDSCTFTDPDLSRSLLDEVGLRLCRLGRVLFLDQSLSEVDFSGADLSGARLLKLTLEGCDFSGAALTGAVLVGCRGVECRFVGAELGNIRMVENCDFSGADFSGANLQLANLRGAGLADACFAEADLSGADLSAAVAERAIFHRARGIGAQFVTADLRQADLSGANLMQASLERADLRSSSLRGANLFAADLARVHVVRETDFDDALTNRMRTYPRKFRRDAGEA